MTKKKRTKILLMGVALPLVSIIPVLSVVSCTTATPDSTKNTTNGTNSTNNTPSSSSTTYSQQFASDFNNSTWSYIGTSNMIQLNTNYTFSDLMSILATWSQYFMPNQALNSGNYVLSGQASAWNNLTGNYSILQNDLYSLSSNVSTAVFYLTTQGTYPSWQQLHDYGLNLVSQQQLIAMCYLINLLLTNIINNPTSEVTNPSVELTSWNTAYDYFDNFINTQSDPAATYPVLFNLLGMDVPSVMIHKSTTSSLYVAGINLQTLLTYFSAWLPSTTASTYLSQDLEYIGTQSVKPTSSWYSSWPYLSPSYEQNASSSPLNSFSWTYYNTNNISGASSYENYSYLPYLSSNTNQYIFGTTSQPFQNMLYNIAGGGSDESLLFIYPSLTSFLINQLTSNNMNIVNSTDSNGNMTNTLNTFDNYTITADSFISSFFMGSTNWTNSSCYSNSLLSGITTTLNVNNINLISPFLDLLDDNSSNLSTITSTYGAGDFMYPAINLLGSYNVISDTNLPFSSIIDEYYSTSQSYVSSVNNDINYNIYYPLSLLGLTNQNFLNLSFITNAPDTSSIINGAVDNVTTSNNNFSWNTYINSLYATYFDNSLSASNLSGLLQFGGSYFNTTASSSAINTLANDLQSMLKTYFNFYSNSSTYSSSNSVPFMEIRIFNNEAWNSTEYYPLILYVNKETMPSIYPNNITQSKFDTEVKNGYSYFDNVAPVQGTPTNKYFYYVTYQLGNNGNPQTNLSSWNNDIPLTSYNTTSSTNTIVTKINHKNAIKLTNIDVQAVIKSIQNNINQTNKQVIANFNNQ